MRMQSGNHFLAIADDSESVSQSLAADSAIHYNMDQPTVVEEAPFSPEECEIISEASFLLPLYTSILPEGLGPFIGLTIAPGFALVDTGAQHGVLGPASYAQVEDRLAVHGLKPRVIDTLQLVAAGVGGSTKFILSAEIPVALQGACASVACWLLSRTWNEVALRTFVALLMMMTPRCIQGIMTEMCSMVRQAMGMPPSAHPRGRP